MAGMRHMGTAAQVGKFALLVDRDGAVFQIG